MQGCPGSSLWPFSRMPMERAAGDLRIETVCIFLCCVTLG